MSEQELLPCPFCGGEASVTAVGVLGSPEKIVNCTNDDCHVSTPFALGDFAIAAWNRRPAPPAAGGVVVPSVPTEAMIEAAEKMADDLPLTDWGKTVHPTPEQVWAAMLAAAPQQSAQGGSEVAPMAWIRFEPDLPPGEECVTFCTLPPKNPDEWIALIPAPPKTVGGG